MRLLVVGLLVWIAVVPQPATVTLFTTADANEWIEAADRHEPGVADEHLKKIAQWRGDRLIRALGVVVTETLSSDSVNAHLERAALLHADISFLNRTSPEPVPQGVWPSGGGGLLVEDGREVGKQHLDPQIVFGRRIIANMRPPDPKPFSRPNPSAERLRIRNWLAAHARNPRIRQWYRAVSADLASVQWLADLQPHLNDAHRLLEDDAGHHFDAGCLAELIASPQIQHVVPRPTASQLNTLTLRSELDVLALSGAFNLSEAEREYRDALKVDPTYDEARVRLARILSLKGHYREALELLKAPITSRDQRVRYYHRLILADGLERDGRVSEALHTYTQASEIFPRAQSALIPTVRLSRELADDAARTLAASRMAELSRQEGRDDPWWVYYDCNGRNRDREVNALWQMFKERRP